MSVQFAHAMENHSHDVCELDYIKHFHNNDLDCEFNHFLFDTSATTDAKKDEEKTSSNYTIKPQFYSENHIRVALLTSKTRGPPDHII